MLKCYRFFDKISWEIFFVRAHDKGEAQCIADYFRVYPCEMYGEVKYEYALACEGAIIYEKPLTVDW